METELTYNTRPANVNLALQAFTEKLNREPDPSELDKTPDGKASTLPISFVEMTLDEIFFGQWGTRNFTTRVIANEVCGEIELFVIHPITGNEIVRTGAAAIIIQVDKAPEGVNRSEWANDPRNKKPNALDLGYPKLKAECLKNAAQSLGKIFGRDLNRKAKDTFKRAFKAIPDEVIAAAVERVKGGANPEHIIAQLDAVGILSDENRTLILNTEKIKQLI
jgi:hypothetical protein